MLDINTAIEDGAQLGHVSSLQVGQRVPEGKRYHGSPAQETNANYCTVEAMPCSSLRRWALCRHAARVRSRRARPACCAGALSRAADRLSRQQRHAGRSCRAGLGTPVARRRSDARVFRTADGRAGGWPADSRHRAQAPATFLQEGKTYVRYGVHYFIYRTISRLSNAAYFGLLFGDSALIVHYLKWIGYKLNKVVQTGANFGLDQRHGVPTLCDIGTGTMVSDGLTMSNALMSSSSFRLGTVKIGDHNYLGNRIYYPADGKTGANCLLGTKVMIPVDGPVRENVGLLGSPCFEIPRAVERDQTMAAMEAGTLRESVRAKTRYNVASMVGLVLSGWFYLVRCRALAVRRRALFPAARLRISAGVRSVHADHRRPLVQLPREGRPRLQAAHADGRVDVRPALLAARALLEVHRLAAQLAVQRHAVQERDVAPPRRQGRPQGVRRWLPLLRQDPHLRSATTPR